jgi:hypothetical protein
MVASTGAVRPNLARAYARAPVWARPAWLIKTCREALPICVRERVRCPGFLGAGQCELCTARSHCSQHRRLGCYSHAGAVRKCGRQHGCGQEASELLAAKETLKRCCVMQGCPHLDSRATRGQLPDTSLSYPTHMVPDA